MVIIEFSEVVKSESVTEFKSDSLSLIISFAFFYFYSLKDA